MSLALMVVWALAATASPAPAESSPGWADSQIIVVEVPESSLSTPTASPTPSPSPTRTPAATPAVADPGTGGHLPATGVDAVGLAIASALGVAALGVGVLVRRSRRRRA